jgi:hypothetical protein
MTETLLVIQPGRFGDIVICLAMAKYYFESGYESVPIVGSAERL